MFLFLSKLLPLFIYPLGLACLLLMVALILAWKLPRWTPFPIALALVILLLAGNAWVSQSLARSLEWQNIPESTLPTAEAIVVLGGGIKPADAPRPMIDLAEQGDRVIYAAQLYHENKAPLIIVSGGRIDWAGDTTPESADMATLLEILDVPSTAIIQEPDSLNTYQNAVNTRKILEAKGINNILLVTSALHMPRSRLIFQKQGFEVIPAPTDFLISEKDLQNPNPRVEDTFLSLIPSAGNIAITTDAIKEYIGMVIYRLRGWL